MQKEWRGVICYRQSQWLVGYFDTAEEAQRETALSARLRSEESIRHLEVDAKDGTRYRQYWGGRSPRGEWATR